MKKLIIQFIMNYINNHIRTCYQIDDIQIYYAKLGLPQYELSYGKLHLSTITMQYWKNIRF